VTKLEALKVLGLGGFDLKEIKKAYRRLASIYHPDVRETGCADSFKTVSFAYEFLVSLGEDSYIFTHEDIFDVVRA